MRQKTVGYEELGRLLGGSSAWCKYENPCRPRVLCLPSITAVSIVPPNVNPAIITNDILYRRNNGDEAENDKTSSPDISKRRRKITAHLKRQHRHHFSLRGTAGWLYAANCSDSMASCLRLDANPSYSIVPLTPGMLRGSKPRYSKPCGLSSGCFRAQGNQSFKRQLKWQVGIFTGTTMTPSAQRVLNKVWGTERRTEGSIQTDQTQMKNTPIRFWTAEK